MSKLLAFGIAMVTCAAFFGSAGPAAANDDYCRRGVTDYMLSCGFASLTQCQATSSGRGGDCIPNPSPGAAASAYAYAPVTHKHRRK